MNSMKGEREKERERERERKREKERERERISTNGNDFCGKKLPSNRKKQKRFIFI